MSDQEYTFRSCTKDPGADKRVTLNLYKYCAVFWRRNELYATNEYVRPAHATGFSYQCNASGLSGSREPIWPRVVGQTVTDGSIVWTCRAADANGLDAIDSPLGSSDPTGLTVTGVSASESTKILATYSGGQLGQDYDAVFTFTLGGVPRVARQTVKIRKR